jgi:hypothetical protein
MKSYPVLLIACLLLTTACSKKTDDTNTQATTPPTAATPAETAKAPEKRPEPPPPVVVPAGTAITVKTQSALGSKTSNAGDAFNATVATPVSIDGKEAIPAGAEVAGTVVEAKSQGKIKGQGSLELTLTSITVKGNPYTIQTSNYEATVKGKGTRTAETTGGGAALGALIGGLAGHGKGAAIGAVAGAGAGLAGGAYTGNKQIDLPAESALTFTLSSPITLK